MGAGTGIVRGIEAAGIETRYDAACKRLLAERQVLARILRGCVTNYAGMALADVEACIEGEPLVGSEPVGRDAAAAVGAGGGDVAAGAASAGGDNASGAVGDNAAAGAGGGDVAAGAAGAGGHNARGTDGASTAGRVRAGGTRIVGLPTVDDSIAEGSVAFDVLFDAAVPGGGRARLTVNVEAQNRFNPGYPLPSRAMFYCGRLLSRQGGGAVAGGKYENLSKVCSVWICTNAPAAHAGTASRFYVDCKSLVGNAPYERESYDKIEVVMLCLGSDMGADAAGNQRGDDAATKELLGFLGTLLLGSMDPRVRIGKLHGEYGVEVDEKLTDRVVDMCNLSQGILERGIEQGIERGIEQGIERGIEQGIEQGIERGETRGVLRTLRAMMANLSLTAEQALAAAGVPDAEWPRYLEELAPAATMQ